VSSLPQHNVLGNVFNERTLVIWGYGKIGRMIAGYGKVFGILDASPQVAVQSLVGKRVDAAFLFEPQARIAKLVAPVKQIYGIGAVWPLPCMMVITPRETLGAQREAIDLL